MITKVIRLSDLPVLSQTKKDIGDSKLIAVINNKSYSISLKQIKQNSIELITGQLIELSNGSFNRIEIYWDDGEQTRLLLKNGSDGEPGLKGQTGIKGPVGQSNADKINQSQYNVFKIINDNITDDINSAWSAYCGYNLNEFLKSISEIFMDEYSYDLMFTEENMQFVNLEFNSSTNNSQIINDNNGPIILYKKYWTYEDDGELQYFINTADHSTEFTINTKYYIWDDNHEINNPKYDPEDENNKEPEKLIKPQYIETDVDTYNNDDNVIHMKYIINYYINTDNDNKNEYSVKIYNDRLNNNQISNDYKYFVSATEEYKYYIWDNTLETYKVTTYQNYIHDDNTINPKYIQVNQKEFNIQNDYYLNPDNNNIYATRQLIYEYDEFTGEISNTYWQYNELTKPVWLELEFTTDEDQLTNIINTDYLVENDIEEKPNDSKEDEIIIINKPIESISVNVLNNHLILPINSVVTIPVIINPSDYTDNVYINYDENIIKVFEDGRIMAIKENVEETYIEIYSTDDLNIPNKYPQKYVKLKISVVTYVESLDIKDYINDKYITSVEGFKSQENKPSIYTIIPVITPLTSTNKSLEWSIVDPLYARIFVDDESQVEKSLKYYIYNISSDSYIETTQENYDNYVIPETGEHYTQEEIDNAQEGDDAYEKTIDDWKVEPLPDNFRYKYTSDIIKTNDIIPINIELLKEGNTTIEILTSGSTVPEIYTLDINIYTGITDIVVPEESIKLLVNIATTLDIEVLPKNSTFKKVIWYKDPEELNDIILEESENNNNSAIIRPRNIINPTGKIYVKSDDGYLDNLIKEINYHIEMPVTNISINYDTSGVVSLDKNEEITLNATVNDSATNKELVWTSSNTSIFDIIENPDGSVTIKAINGGDAIITVEATDGSGKKVSFNMKCIELTERIEIRNNISHIFVGNDYAITYSDDLTIDNAIIYNKENGNSEIKLFTSDNSIAEVRNNNILHINSAGNFKLYAKAMDNAAFITNINIKSYLSTEELILDEDEIYMSINDTYTIIASVYPDETTYQKISFVEIIEDNQESKLDIDYENGVINPKTLGNSIVMVSTIANDEDGVLSKLLTVHITE